MSDDSLTAISLFSSGGIGDLAFSHLNVEVLVSNEFLADRHSIFAANFPKVECLTGDIIALKDQIIEATMRTLRGRQLDILYATPPCQGMSKNGRGKLLQGIRRGEKPELDVRNRLIIPTLDLCHALKPLTVIFENVPEMENTVIEEPKGRLIGIIDYIRERLGPGYDGKGEVVEFANYGVPQRRQRLLTIFTRHPRLLHSYRLRNSLIAPQTHSESGVGRLRPWKTVRDTIAHLPRIDGRRGIAAKNPALPLHTAPALDEDKYFWVSNTPPDSSAFDNQCVACKFTGNPTHRAGRGDDGINRASLDTPIKCVKCGALLPRPWVREKSGNVRLMKGFTSAYRRMSWDSPSNALTTNFAYACSDSKVHPEQHRALSVLEALMLQTISDFQYEWRRTDGKPVGIQLIRDIIGESVPPKGLEALFRFLITELSTPDHERVAFDRTGNRELALL